MCMSVNVTLFWLMTHVTLANSVTPVIVMRPVRYDTCFPGDLFDLFYLCYL